MESAYLHLPKHEKQGSNNTHLALVAGIIFSEVVQRLPPEYKDPATFS